jgi:hypothetical protein
VRAEFVVEETRLGRIAHLALGDHPARRRSFADEVDTRVFAYDAASAVAADEVTRSDRLAVRNRDLNTVVGLGESSHLGTAKDRRAELADNPVGQHRFESSLWEREHVAVPRREVADVEERAAEAVHRVHRARLDEAVDHTALVEDLERAGQETAGARAVERVVRPSLDDEGVHPAEP